MTPAAFVVGVVGAGHSGSTLLDLLLGNHSRVLGLGEVATFPDYFATDGGLPWTRRGCTCGVHVRQCRFWDGVRGRLAGRPADPLAVLRAAAGEGGKPYLCDSSKDIERLLALRRAGAVAGVVLLVRDGRAVGYSYRRRAAAGDPHPPPWDDYLPAVQSWAALARRVADEFGPVAVTVRYEDLVADPATELARVLGPLGLAVEPGQVRLDGRPRHNLGGNRMRMRPGAGIRLDAEYRDALSAADWEAGTAAAADTLRAFGYPSGK